MLNSNLLAFVITFSVAILWLRLNDFAAHKGWISSWLSRKLIHIGTGPLFVFCWVLFDDTFTARLLATVIPLLITAQFVLVGFGIIKDEAAVKALSRTGDRREILRGPLYYGIIFVLITLLYWKSTPIGITALMLMCGGDGLAEILGRKFGKNKLPWNTAKSFAGSAGMFLGGWSLSVLVTAYLSAFQSLDQPLVSSLAPITIIAAVGVIIESLPLKNIDNITITLSALILGHLLF
jgi:phytol kinase